MANAKREYCSCRHLPEEHGRDGRCANYLRCLCQGWKVADLLPLKDILPARHSPAEAALRKLLADVQEAREWWDSKRNCAAPGLLGSLPERLSYLERLAREGLGEPAPTGSTP